jgi:pimeloyl-ACP methyl ester carboxylesterase
MAPTMAPTDSPPVSAFDYNETPNQYVKVDGVRLAYRTLGPDTGERPLVLLQHFTGTMDDWDPEVVEGLARGRRVYVFDNAGVGASEGVTPDSLERMAQYAEDFVDALQLGPVDLLGFSMGGAIAQQFVFDRPTVVRKVVLAGTATKGSPGMDKLPGVVEEAFRRGAKERSHPKAFLFFTETADGKLAAKEFIGRINKHTVDPDPPASAATAASQLKAIMMWAGAPPDNAKLAAITQPVLIVNGSNDVMAPTQASYELFQRIPRAQLVLYPDSGHGALFQYHDAFVQQVDRFLRSSL